MKKDDVINIALLVFIHTVLTFLALESMFLWISAFPYTEAGINASGVVYAVNKECFPTLQILSAVSLVINLLSALISKFTCKTFMIIHLVLAELCLAHILTLFFA